MAVTNHLKKQESPPAWVARGKLRLGQAAGGPAETARMLLCGEWDYTPGMLLSANHYGAGLVDELAARKVNAVCLTWSAGFSHEADRPQWECVRRLLPLLKKKKIKAIAQVSLTQCFGDELLKRVPQAALWLEHDPAGQPVARCQGRALRMAPNHPGWRQYVAHKVSAAVDAGFDGIYFDGVEKDLEATAGFIRSLRATARGWQKLNERELLFYAHAPLLSPVMEACNFKFTRLPVRPGLLPEGGLSCNLPFLKLAFEDGGREKAFAAGFCAGEFSPKEKALAIAEILASGGICAELHSPAEYSVFQWKNSALFGPADPINLTGVLLPAADGGACDCPQLLTKLNLQYDLIPVPQFQSFEFRKYKLLSALHLSAPSAPLVEALNTFVREHKGTLLISSETCACFGLQAGAEERTETALGAGRIIAYKTSVQAQYQQNMAADIIKFSPQPVSVQAAEGVLVQLWGKGTTRWVHVLNYRGEPADAAVNLPGCGGRKLRLYSPDKLQPGLKVLETGKAVAAFALTGLETYCIVEVA